MRRLTLLLGAVLQRSCALLLCIVCGDRTKEAQHGALARKRSFSASRNVRAKSILFKAWLSEIQNILSLEAERFGRDRTVVF